jgi:hypothetical protein
MSSAPFNPSWVTDRSSDVSARPVLARGVPLLEQFVYGLGDPVVDRVAEAGQEFLVRRQVRVETGRTSGWR